MGRPEVCGGRAPSLSGTLDLRALTANLKRHGPLSAAQLTCAKLEVTRFPDQL